MSNVIPMRSSMGNPTTQQLCKKGSNPKNKERLAMLVVAALRKKAGEKNA